MMPGCHLNGRGVLVTRPQGQAEHLCELVASAGGDPVAFPTLEIRPVELSDAARERMRGPWDIILFVSRNAVDLGLEHLRDSTLDQPSGRRPLIGAVGRATAAALRKGGLAPDLVPERGFDSEALLALPALTDARGRRVLIVRGVGGRALLGEILAERGATVGFAEVYQRGIPRTDLSGVLPEWRRTLGFVTASSDEVLQNLCSMVPGAHHAWLHSLPLAVMSERGGVTAMQLGFRTVAVASETSDEGILDALCRLAMSRRPAP